jgi:SAM-dependent methyltransferase
VDPRSAPFDLKALSERRQRAAARWASQAGADYLLAHACDDLLDRLAVVQRPLRDAVVLGRQDGRLGVALRATGRLARVVELDDIKGTPSQTPSVLTDFEALPLATASVDLVVSPLRLQFVNDLPGVLMQLRHALRPDGLLLANLVGGESLNELRYAFAAAEAEVAGGASPRVSPFADGRDLAGLLQRAGFALPVVDTDRMTVAYPHPIALMHDLRRMGATNVLAARARTPLRQQVLMRACEVYAERFARADGKVLATFERVTLTAWAPAATQQQPLRPGSARVRLADALATQEIPAGDAAAPLKRP